MGICSKLDTLSILYFNNVIPQPEQCRTTEILNKADFWAARKIRGGF